MKTTCQINGCQLAQHDPNALDLHEGKVFKTGKYEVSPIFDEKDPAGWTIDAWVMTSHELTPEETRNFARDLNAAADWCEEHNAKKLLRATEPGAPSFEEGV